jgi:CBS domain-containing protein
MGSSAHNLETASDRQVALSIAPSLVASTIETLQRHAPFDRMDVECLAWVVQRFSVVYFAPDAVVLEPGEAPPPYLYVVRQGAVVGSDPAEPRQDSFRFRVSVGESFPLGALLGRRPVTSRYRAVGDTFCFRLAATDLRKLMDRSPEFQAFASQRLGTLLAIARRQTQAERSVEQVRQPLERSIRELLRSDVVQCRSGSPVREALEKMQRGRVGSALIIDGENRPVGIFTLRDLRDRVALTGYPVDAPIDAVMTRDPVTIQLDAMAYDAALLMTHHGFHHVVVVDEGRAAGVLAESDLFALQRVGLSALSAALRSAATIDRLRAVSSQLIGLGRTLLAQGLGSEQVARILSTLNDRLTSRIVEIEAQAASIPLDAFAWLALGSEGRHEQTLATDQDNAIVFPDPPDGDADAARARLLPFARRVNEALAACGFPLCRGSIMASNPLWCLSESEWRERFATWVGAPDGEALLNCTIAFDFRPLCGNVEAGSALRAWLSEQTRSRGLLLRLMTQSALRNEPPLGTLRDFVVDVHGGRADTIDIKVNGTALFVDAARILSVAVGDGHTNTAERLRAAARERSLVPSEVDGWIDAFAFLQSVRFAHQLAQVEAGEAADNFVAPDALNTLDRRILREALRQARKLQERLRLDYRL